MPRWLKFSLGGIGLVLFALVCALAYAPYWLDGMINRVEGPPLPPVSAEAQALHESLFIADLHIDATLWPRDLEERHTKGQTDLPRLLEGNVALQIFAATTKSPRASGYTGVRADALDAITLLSITQGWPIETWTSLKARALYHAEQVKALADARPEAFTLLRSREDLEELANARREGRKRVGALLATEGSHPLEGDLSNIDELHAAGYRMMALQHFFDNRLGGSLHGISGEGLTDFGRAAVTRMLELGIIIDLAHSSEAVVRDVLAMGEFPLVVSHTGFQGHCETPRNIPDSLMQAIASRDALLGVGYWAAAVCDTSPEAIVASILYGIELVGADSVALGSDFDGAVVTPIDTSQLVVITQLLLESGLAVDDIRKVMGGNALRFFEAHLDRPVIL